MIPKKQIVSQLDAHIQRFHPNQRPTLLLYLRNRIVSDDTSWQQDKNFLAALAEWVINSPS